MEAPWPVYAASASLLLWRPPIPGAEACNMRVSDAPCSDFMRKKYDHVYCVSHAWRPVDQDSGDGETKCCLNGFCLYEIEYRSSMKMVHRACGFKSNLHGECGKMGFDEISQDEECEEALHRKIQGMYCPSPPDYDKDTVVRRCLCDEHYCNRGITDAHILRGGHQNPTISGSNTPGDFLLMGKIPEITLLASWIHFSF